MQLAASKSVLILMIMAGLFTGRAAGDEREARVELIRSFVDREVAPELWWAVPQDSKWSNFEFLEIKGASRDGVFEMLKNATFSETAGNFLLLDAPFEYCDKKGQGFLVLVDPRKMDSVGLRFRAIATDKKSLEFVSILKFEPDGKEIKYKFDSGLEGIILKGDFRSLLLKSRE